MHPEHPEQSLPPTFRRGCSSACAVARGAMCVRATFMAVVASPAASRALKCDAHRAHERWG